LGERKEDIRLDDEAEWQGLRRESAQAKVGRMIREELKRLGRKESEFEGRASTEPAKLALAARLRGETTLTIGQIAQGLHVGSWKSLSNKLYLRSRAKESRKR
jgi:hypothetical protein